MNNAKVNKRNATVALCVCAALLSFCGCSQDAAPAPGGQAQSSGGKGTVHFPGSRPTPQQLQAMSQAAAQLNRGGPPGPAQGAAAPGAATQK